MEKYIKNIFKKSCNERNKSFDKKKGVFAFGYATSNTQMTLKSFTFSF